MVIKPEVGKFFHDYTREFPRLADLYFGDPASVDKLVEMTQDPYLRMIKRPRLHEVLHAYNQAIGAPPAAMENVDRLRMDGAYAILAWQQPYLLGGPLETFLKALTAIKLAERLNATGSAKFVPVLWIHADDHWLSEVNRVKLAVGTRLVEERLEVDETERPSEAVETGAAYDALMGRLERHLGETAHKGWLLEILRASKGENLADHCARFLTRVFGDHGLVLACPRIFRQEISAVLAKAIESPDRVDRLLAGQKKALEEKGYACHTDWQGDPLTLYRITDGAPLRLKWTGGKFLLEATGGEMTPAQVGKENKGWPQIYTNGVYLSPLEQDSCIPSVATIAGPGGCEFWGVLKPVFDEYRVAFPMVFPQCSATLVGKRAARGLAQLGKKLEDLIAEARAPEPAGEKPVPVDHGAALAQLRGEVTKAVDAYKVRAAEVQAEHLKLAQETKDLIMKELGRMAETQGLALARDGVLAALGKFGERATQVSPTVAAALADVRRRIEESLTLKVEPAGLGASKADIARAATGLVAAAQPIELPAVKALEAELSGILDGVGRSAIEAANKGAAETVSETDLAKVECAPEGGLQEDEIGMAYFLNEKGPGLVKEVADAVDVFDFRHQVVQLD
jgi:bacillithiol biosynthesis cysteine-adding enzyme BshC